MSVKADMVFLANRIDTFLELVQDPEAFFNRNPDSILPESFDLKVTAAALFLLVDCYLRGKGLIDHPASSTRERARDALTSVWEAVNQEVKDRPYMYRKLQETLGRGQASVEIDSLLEGYSKWAPADEQ